MNWSAFWGAFTGTLLNLVELGVLAFVVKATFNIQREIRALLKQFKLEGEDEKWLR